MNVWYFDKQIPDELHGAKDYIKRAIEIRPMYSSWAKTLADMSAGELEHATCLYKMYQEYYAKMAETYAEQMPEYIESSYQNITDEYTKCSAEIKYLHDMFKQ